MSNVSSNFTLKVSIIGDPFVGKTSLVHKYMGKEFSKRYQKTFGSDISFKQVEIKDTNNNIHKITFSIWDIAGEIDYDELTKQYLIGTQAVIFMYDIENSQSYKHISNWFDKASQKLDLTNMPVVLVGNKIDLRIEDNEFVRIEDGELLFATLAKKYHLNDQNFYFIETSALVGTNISKIFELLSEIIINNFVAQSS